MRRGSSGALFEPPPERRDTELTLGPVTLALLTLGLLALCGVCFVFGYAVGHRASSPLQATQVGSPAVASAPASTQPKPSASASSFEPPAPQPVDATTNGVPAGTPASGAAGGAAVPVSPAAQVASPAPAVVQTALPVQTAVASQAGNPLVHPALSQGPSWMVQIAAVSTTEDAQMLVGALRSHGYAVAVRRSPADSLMHIEVGPYSTHQEAAAMRQRLLNDGYNAIILP